MVLMVLMVPLAQQDMQVQPVLLALQAKPDPLVRTERRVPKEQLDHMEYPERREARVLLVLKALLDPMGILVL